jgi:hypothetical protein
MVPGFERNTRNRQVLKAKCWIMVAWCISLYASHFIHVILCIQFYASNYIHLVLSISFYASHYTHLILGIRCKMVENQYNNLALGFHLSQGERPLLRIITTNMLRVSRVNKRAMDGPARLLKSRLDILEQVNETYDSRSGLRLWSPSSYTSQSGSRPGRSLPKWTWCTSQGRRALWM